MLASISPFGERARGNRWGRTVAAFAVGSTLGGVAIGAAAGGLGSLVPGRGWRLPALAVAAVAAGVIDGARPGWVPTSHRQVNEDWLPRYRGWVYGAGFGAQLGAGVVTVVTTATVYAWLVAAALTGSILGGSVVGLSFGAGRALPMVAVRSADTPQRLRRVLVTVTGWAATARRVAATAAVAVGLTSTVAWWRG